MPRLINTESAGKKRAYLTKAIVAAIRELAGKNAPDEEARDLAAFTVLSLQEVHETIELSVVPWEKRGYWIKADRFRLEWAWVEQYAVTLKKAIAKEEWLSVAQISAQVLQRLGTVKVSKQHRMGTPWVGARQKLQKEIDC